MNIKTAFQNFGRALVDAIKRAYLFIVSDDAMDRMTKTAERIAKLAEQVLPIVRMVALLTPNQADDLIVALVERLNVKIKAYLGMSNEEKNAALKASAVALARKSFPELEKFDDATLYAAIDLSYRLLKDIGIKESVEVPQ